MMINKDLDPYIGPRPFQRNPEDQARFFGRSYESKQIIARIFGNQIVLIYGKSGVGKTSIINAQVVPMLEENGSEVFPAARISGYFRHWIENQSPSNNYVFNALQSLRPDIDPKVLIGKSFSEFLNDHFSAQDMEKRPFPHVIIFDQFEEFFGLFGLLLDNERNQQEDFLMQVTEALDRYSDLSIVFVMREDYLAELDPFMHILPERKSRFRLESLRREAAYQAIVGPLKALNTNEVTVQNSEVESDAKAIVNDLLKINIETPYGSSSLRQVEGEFIEPIQLQVVCRRWWHVKQGEQQASKVPGDIRKPNLGELPNVNDALIDFYEEAVFDTSKQTGIPEKDIRSWFQHKFITASGTRAIVYRDSTSTAGMPNNVVEILENKYLIRGEMRSGALWYELPHDRLIGPIQDSNTRRLRRESKGVKRYFSFKKVQ